MVLQTFGEARGMSKKTRPQLDSRINLSRAPLQHCGADVLAYASKDNADMGGGLPQALSLACGEELGLSLRAGLAECPREVGDIVWTPAFKLEGTRFISHIVGIKADTPRGDWCDDPSRLEAGVYQTLRLAEQAGAEVVAFANLATGASRAPAAVMARLMIGPMRSYFRECRDSRLRIMVCLPDWQDYEAFQKALSSQI